MTDLLDRLLARARGEVASLRPVAARFAVGEREPIADLALTDQSTDPLPPATTLSRNAAPVPEPLPPRTVGPLAVRESVPLRPAPAGTSAEAAGAAGPAAAPAVPDPVRFVAVPTAATAAPDSHAPLEPAIPDADVTARPSSADRPTAQLDRPATRQGQPVRQLGRLASPEGQPARQLGRLASPEGQPARQVGRPGSTQWPGGEQQPAQPVPGRRDSGQPAPVTVRLTVDRVEVRLPAPAPARRESSREGRERRDSRPGRRPELSLDEYVRHREDRRP